MDDNGTWKKTGRFCAWCRKPVRVWVSDFDDSGELPDPECCSIMCEFERISFGMRNGWIPTD
jgi:hypothetical protein